MQLSHQIDERTFMQIAVPLDNKLSFYKQNPFTAPKFGIYFISTDTKDANYSIDKVVDNPQYINSGQNFSEIQQMCSCTEAIKKSLNHICEHYALLEVLSNCSYLLANKFCDNTYNTLKKGGIKVFKVPAIINTADMAIKNFIIGVSLANQVKNIVNVS